MAEQPEQSDELIAAAMTALAEKSLNTWKPPSVDERMGWGKHKDRTYRECASIDPGFCQWAAKTIAGVKGQLCAEALAIALGVTE